MARRKEYSLAAPLPTDEKERLEALSRQVVALLQKPFTPAAPALKLREVPDQPSTPEQRISADMVPDEFGAPGH